MRGRAREEAAQTGGRNEEGPSGAGGRALERLVQASCQITRQRRAVVQVLAGSDHPTAGEIYGALRNEGVAIATVYRTLRLFAKVGVVRQLRARDGCVRYELVGPPHAHFVCLNCGRVFNADEQDVRGGGFRRRGFVVTDSEICLFGYCPACSGKGSSRGEEDEAAWMTGEKSAQKVAAR